MQEVYVYNNNCSVSTASQQIDVFSRILKTSVASILQFRGSSLENIITDLVKLVGTQYGYFLGRGEGNIL